MTMRAATVRKILRDPPAAVASPLAALDDARLLDRVRAMAHFKRFLERYCADVHFRGLLTRDMDSALRAFNLEAAPEDVAVFLEATNNPAATRPELWPASLRAFRDFMLECSGGLEILQAAARSTSRPFHSWRTRQLARLRFDFSAAGDGIVRPAIAFELSKGCTVGCWFCAVSAEKFAGNFPYADGREWRECLAVLRDLLGPAAAAAFCYWATDPLDNPDYEQFARDFHQVTGLFPPTTTALPLKHPERTRALLDLSQSLGCRLNRFSVLSLPMLDRLHRQFSAADLAFVELVLQNPEALVFTDFPKTCVAGKVNAGKILGDASVATTRGVSLVSGTIACVAGFLVNMVERRLRLVSPCMADEEWPLGYRVLETAGFSGPQDLGLRVEGMIDKHMPERLPADHTLQFLPGLQYVAFRDGFSLSTPNHAIEFRDGWGRFGLNYPALGGLVKRGDSTAAEIAAELVRCGGSPAQIDEAMTILWQNGVLAGPGPFGHPLVTLAPRHAPEVAYHD